MVCLATWRHLEELSPMISSRKLLSLLLTTLLMVPSLSFGAQAAAQTPATGQVSGIARAANGKSLANYTARLRDTRSGQIVRSVTTGTNGQFSLEGLAPGDYLVEVVDATGKLVGVSSPISLTTSALVVSNVSVGAASSAAAAGAAAAGHGLVSFFSSTAIIAAAAASGVTAAVIAATGSASPSR